VVYIASDFVRDGGLLSYGPDQVDLFRRAASYVDRILRGEKPGDLPVQVPTKFEMVVNLKTAKALGLNVPQSLLAIAVVMISDGGGVRDAMPAFFYVYVQNADETYRRAIAAGAESIERPADMLRRQASDDFVIFGQTCGKSRPTGGPECGIVNRLIQCPCAGRAARSRTFL
jgi:hypothetical protein